MDIKRILLAYSGSENSKRAIDDAINIATCYGANVLILHCIIEETKPEGTYQRAQKAPSENAPYGPEVDALLTPVRNAFERKSVEYSDQVLSGDPARLITEVAGLMNCDLIIMGRSSMTPSKRLPAESTTGRVVGAAPCRILVVV